MSARSTPSGDGSHSGVGMGGMMPGVLRTVTATRYVTPLREGGSLPGLVEADDDGLYVLKFAGAGQGPRALAAASAGTTPGVASPPGAPPYSTRRPPAAGLAAEIVWFDALVTNVDRTP